LLSELYHEQSSRWPTIANDHLTEVFALTTDFVDKALNCIIVEDGIKNEVRHIMEFNFENKKRAAAEELKSLVEDEKRQPITYNHYYTDNIQNARQDSIQAAMQSVVENDLNGELHVSNTAVDSGKFLASLQKRVIVDMDDQACSEAQAGLKAYYKVCSS
jgi:hypothetical protein